MSDETKGTNEELDGVTDGEVVETSSNSSYEVPENTDSQDIFHHIPGMYRTWFLDYASYVILERAVPHLDDGLKPVQRRILHSMKRLDDGRYNKVANIVGHTMQFHPHGDASIGGALVTLGQKDLLIDCQGNWGNILTGDSAAAPRYIEARLSKFALDVVFSPKVTEWKASYDGRNKEPITLPVKFPLLLAQGVEGIAVGLSSKILPHNFNEILDAAVAYLNDEPFELYPDFQTGGLIDVSHYNDGERGGRVRVRAKISKIDNKTLVINDIPYGKTTNVLIDSILKANEKGKINIRKVEDNTSDHAEILIHLESKTSSDKTIDALYAFTDCEVNISPCCCVIHDKKPMFTNVSSMLKMSVDRTKDLLRQELLIQRGELLEQLHYCSLEKIFIEERIYKDKKFEDSKNVDAALDHIATRLEPFRSLFVRDVTREDLQRLLEIKMARILKFNSDKSEEQIVALKQQIESVDYNLEHLVAFTIAWYKSLKNKYGEKYPRLTEIRNFETIEASKVVEANEKLYVNWAEGFVGTALKKDDFVCNCSDIDDIILIHKDGKYQIIKVPDKKYVGKDIIHVNVFRKNDKRTVYNVAYRDGKTGFNYIKRFAITGVSRDKDYDITQGTPGSKILYFSANSNAEAETIHVVLKPRLRLKVSAFDRDFGEIAIKGRQSMGNILTKNEVMRITLKQRGSSTLGGRSVWFDRDVLRLNYDGRGEPLGDFQSEDKILVVSSKGEYYLSGFEDTNHFDEDVMIVEKFDPEKIWTVALFDANEGFKYLKRFRFEVTNKRQNFIGENPKSVMLLITDTYYPRLKLVFGGKDAHREPLEIDADEFIGVKGMKAKGKRLHTWEIQNVEELEPLRFPEKVEEDASEADEPEEDASQNTDQPTLF
ncbi:MAG: DNA gyrase/topoisomerase IV subunit A [Paludibacteraceae bacterium]|nr:DNA gyrase/topoisomerase IV subunit A [Paludibacteraceae bacterium]